ncbi:hypothetical protein B0H63DRAFT_544325 [Podospora didyma]|uniref:Heterokaryon incompatibility domain-containing protein n=1 Tax=Podospora didyma TaxID=330526 RepID=A0AAE0NQG9_9PEZI|nr:hypothetical protein B0H63DRAFT_544325 [Podospora didyma]
MTLEVFYAWHSARESGNKEAFCKTCGATPNLHELIAQQSKSSPCPPIPPDELPVPTAMPKIPRLCGYTTANSPPTNFDIVCLHGASDNTQLLHVDLETHNCNQCPEYEAISYAWGGEDSDTLRLWRGLRIIWVDAICINQNDVEERTAQVAEMARLYQQCRQVVAYLGPDLRRYFSRVWIIQELVLARQVTIPVGDLELCTDIATAASGPELSGLGWHKTGAPWIPLMYTSGMWEEDIYDILQATATSQASDPRDRDFGVLALLPVRGKYTATLRPDYSLSCHTEVLYNAAGLTAQQGYPSWVPNRATADQEWLYSTDTWSGDAFCDCLSRETPIVDMKGLPRARRGQQWDDGATVDGNTGASATNLTHIFRFPSVPVKVGANFRDMDIFEIRGPGNGMMRL